MKVSGCLPGRLIDQLIGVQPAAAAGCCFPAANICPLHGFQRSTAAALCDLTTEVLRTINATENAMVELGLSEPTDRSHLAGTDVKQADDAFRELEENVSFNHELHASSSTNLLVSN